MIGIFWGAFDPLTPAHQEIIHKALEKLALEKLVIVINNHSYKKYTHSLTNRRAALFKSLRPDEIKKIEILIQDETYKINYSRLNQLFQKPLCAIAGSDAYINWVKHSTEEERTLYSQIAVVPRGENSIELQDVQAFLFPIDPKFKNISSSKTRNGSI